jgi:hypothetical protein
LRKAAGGEHEAKLSGHVRAAMLRRCRCGFTNVPPRLQPAASANAPPTARTRRAVVSRLSDEQHEQHDRKVPEILAERRTARKGQQRYVRGECARRFVDVLVQKDGEKQ